MVSLRGFGSGPRPPAQREGGQGLGDAQVRGANVIAAAMRERGMELHAILWTLRQATGEWRLLLVTPQVESKGPREIVRRTDAIVRNLNGSSSVDIFDVDVTGPTDPEIAH